MSLIWCLPFVLMLVTMAVTPLVHKHWWERNYAYISFALAAVAMGYYALVRHDMRPWLHEVEEYISFITLLAALFTVSGGMVINVLRKATPLVNAVFLLLGAVAANFFGTTGAAVLLVRPFLRINRAHIKPYHLVFFIFVVANAGGCLTPIGDPPLFLGYLRGVPFWWVAEHCWPMWATTVALLVAIFFVIDTIEHGKIARQAPNDAGPVVQVQGIHNLLFMAVIVGAVFRESVFHAAAELGRDVTGMHLLNVITSREVLMIAAAVASKWVTPRAVYERNEFSFGPMKEVAILFVGIFSTMVPVLEYLQANADHLPVKTPGQYYFVAGGLSSVLDNAPTYAAFLQMRLGAIDPADVRTAREEITEMGRSHTLAVRPGLKPEVQQAIGAVVKYHGDDLLSGSVNDDELRVAFLLGDPGLNLFIVALSCGAVFFGACTYIGNGPNFMVKAIADGAGVPMPGFFGYVLRYALPVLGPVYLVLWLIYFSGW